ncbi:MAG: (5-formylfuran-3-yl)methyl phosphate synthase [Planctomycetota bacterium]
MSRVLISVRDLSEAATAIQCDADIIDFKDPQSGPLAPTTSEIWHQASQRFPNATLSAALGEANDAMRCAHLVPATFRYAKMGTQRMTSRQALITAWSSLPLASSIELVAVAYADHVAAECLPVDDVLDAAIESGRQTLLIDTWHKRGKRLSDLLNAFELRHVIDAARQAGIDVMLAGSITRHIAGTLVENGIQPAGWGVRGDVCQPSHSQNHRETSSDFETTRMRRLCPRRVTDWIQWARSISQPQPIEG